MTGAQMTRRRFLVAALTFSTVAATTPTSLWFETSTAWAQSTDPTHELTDVLAHLARVLFPHDGLADETYANVIGGILTATAEDPAMTEVLRSAEVALDTASGQSWMTLNARAQVEAVKLVQDEAFFAAILGTVRGHFYNNPEVWQFIDYPGSSKEYGGYINRGFNDIDWLPEGN
jgi:hypothetical protein